MTDLHKVAVLHAQRSVLSRVRRLKREIIAANPAFFDDDGCVWDALEDAFEAETDHRLTDADRREATGAIIMLMSMLLDHWGELDPLESVAGVPR